MLAKTKALFLFALISSITFLSGCNRTTLPDSYGVFIKDGKQLVRLEPKLPEETRSSFSPKSTILVFDRRLSHPMVKHDDIGRIIPRKFIRFNVERQHDRRNLPEPSDIIIRTADEFGAFGEPLDCFIAPVKGYADMVEFKPRQPLPNGLYYFEFGNERLPFGVQIGKGSERQSPHNQAVDRYYVTAAKSAELSLDSFLKLTQRGAGKAQFLGEYFIEDTYYLDVAALDRDIKLWTMQFESALAEKRFVDCGKYLRRIEAYHGTRSDFGQRLFDAMPRPNGKARKLIAAGAFHSIALKADGSIVAWGYDGHDLLYVPPPNTRFVSLATGAFHNLGLRFDGTIAAWGDNSDGQLNVPPPNTGFVAIAAGWGHSIGLKTDGSIAAWGNNRDGQLNVPSPNTDFVAIAACDSHSIGLKTDGSIEVWGNNEFDQLNVPPPNTAFVDVATGLNHSLGLRSDGSIAAWGDNEHGQLNIPAPNSGFMVPTTQE